MKTALFHRRISMALLLYWAIISSTGAQETKNGLRKIGLDYYLEHVSEPSSLNWHILSLETNIRTGSLSDGVSAIFVPRLNMGQRTGNGVVLFEDVALQGQLDTYLNLSKKASFFANYGYSGATKFANHQAALEFNYSLHKGWGIIAGAKLTHWDKTAVGYLLGAEKYLGRFWITLRPMLVVQEGKTFPALRGGVRYYISEPNSYLHWGFSYGNSPEFANYRPDLSQILSLRSAGTFLSWQQPLSRHFLLHLGVSYRREEYKEDSWRNVMGANAGLIYLLP